MRRFAFFALGATALCAVAFSPGPEVLLALAVIVLIVVGVAAFVHSPPTWLKSTFLTSLATRGWIGQGHVHLRAGGLGAGGRHGPPRSTIVLAVLAFYYKILTSAGHRLALTNTSAQPLPS